MSALCGLYLGAHALSGLNIPLCVYYCGLGLCAIPSRFTVPRRYAGRLFRHRSLEPPPSHATARRHAPYFRGVSSVAFGARRFCSLGRPFLPPLPQRTAEPYILRRSMQQTPCPWPDLNRRHEKRSCQLSYKGLCAPRREDFRRRAGPGFPGWCRAPVLPGHSAGLAAVLLAVQGEKRGKRA